MTTELRLKTVIVVFSQDNSIFLRGRRKSAGAKLCRFYLLPQDDPLIPTEWKSGTVALNYQYLPSIGPLGR